MRTDSRARAMSGSLAQRLEQRMRAAGHNQRSLALAAGLNETYVRDLLRGRSRNPKTGHLAKLAGLLGCSATDLMEPAVVHGLRNSSEPVYEESEIALIHMWRAMTKEGRKTAMLTLASIMLDGTALAETGKQNDI